MTGGPLAAVLPSLSCPVCEQPLRMDGPEVRCPAGHSFDVARQGYLNLAVGARAGTADTAAMVHARERFLGSGHYRPLADLIAHLAVDSVPPPGLVLDLAGGTGYYLAAVLDALHDRAGVCVDLSTPALRRAARAHPRAAAVGADAWRHLPLADAAVAVALTVFGPRDPAELDRVLAPGGLLLAASPGPEHLRELIEPLGMIGVDPHKDDRQARAFGRFERVASSTWAARLTLDHAAVADLVGMGPTAAHTVPAELAGRIAGLTDPVGVSVRIDVTTYRAA